MVFLFVVMIKNFVEYYLIVCLLSKYKSVVVMFFDKYVVDIEMGLL